MAKHDEVRERRKQVIRPHYEKPELLATDPNQVWSWDITKLKGPAIHEILQGHSVSRLQRLALAMLNSVIRC